MKLFILSVSRVDGDNTAYTETSVFSTCQKAVNAGLDYISKLKEEDYELISSYDLDEVTRNCMYETPYDNVEIAIEERELDKSIFNTIF